MNDIAGRELTAEDAPKFDANPEPLAELPKFESEHVFTLSYPVTRINGKQIDEVRLRVPTALDLFEVGGMPSKTQWTNGGMAMEMDVERLQAYIVRLSGLEKPTIYKLPARTVRSMYEWLNVELNSAGN